MPVVDPNANYAFSEPIVQARWKCPDCGGWVSASVDVHYCSPTNKALPYQPQLPFIYVQGGGSTAPNPQWYQAYNCA